MTQRRDARGLLLSQHATRNLIPVLLQQQVLFPVFNVMLTPNEGITGNFKVLTRSQTRNGIPGSHTIQNMEKIEALLRDVRQPKLPAYDPTKLDLWFIRVETEFAAFGIEDDNIKYYAVLRALDGPTTEEITDILSQPPAQDKYTSLKNTIIERFGVSKKDKLRQVLKGIPLCSKKPSQLLREMKNKAAGILPDDALHGLWVEKLPTSLKAFLAMSDDMNLEQLAKMADRIHPEISQDNCVMAVATNTCDDVSATLLSALLVRLDRLEKSVVELSTEIKSIKFKEHRPRPRSQSRSSSQQTNLNNICHYHRKFGINARLCKPPCTFRPSDQENSDRCRQ